jgi:aminoglycoside phosphotransferase (APT) family kinase protein
MSHPNAAALEAAIGRALGQDPSVQYERTVSGVSGHVYRVVKHNSVFYLRLAERATEHLDVDAEILRRLAGLGVCVPKVTHVEHFDPLLHRSFMVMSEIPGEPLDCARSPEQAAQVAHRAGNDLAVLSQIPLQGFGFIRRDVTPWPPCAEFARYDEFVRSYLPTPWPGYLTDAFTSHELDVLRALVESECARPGVASHLAHGDFDVTAIFQVQGSYTGFIDFGQIRGADRFFDLGHFLLHDRETYGAPLFDHLYAGYSEVIPPQATDRMAIVVSGVLLGLRQLCLWRGFRGRSWHHPTVAARTARIREMLSTNDLRPGHYCGDHAGLSDVSKASRSREYYSKPPSTS